MSGSVRELRHQAQEAAMEAQHALNPGYSVAAKVQEALVDTEVAKGLRGELRDLRHSLKGQQGFTKEQQVESLGAAEAKATELRGSYVAVFDGLGEALTTALKEALDAVPSMVEESKAGASGAFDRLEAALSEAKSLAETRDFDAHQAQKAQTPSYAFASGEDDGEEYEPDES